ncbi:MAG: hypothetical protein ABIR18_01335 [Chitinophagaceae bacterium]
MDTVVVTTCSANHLAQAKGFGNSLLRFNPTYKYIIGLADKLPANIKRESFAPYEIVEVYELNIPEFDEMYKRYNTFELNCALKSFFLAYAMKTYQPSKLLFMDSDMVVFDSLEYISKLLDNHSILLTPHIFSPFPVDQDKPQERDILKAGVYNAGFLALRNDDTGNAFLKWWTERMVDQCYEKPKLGMVVDQNWLNLVPVYYNNVKIIEHKGCNVAYWNLHERKVEKQDGKYIVNEKYPLLFFHFSGYQFSLPDTVSRHQSRYGMQDFPVVKELFSIYHEMLKINGHEEMLKTRCFYRKEKSWMQKMGLKK